MQHKLETDYHIHIDGPELRFALTINGQADMVLAENIIEYVMSKVRAGIRVDSPDLADPNPSWQRQVTLEPNENSFVGVSPVVGKEGGQ